MIKLFNSILSFFLELAMLSSFAYAGFHLADNVLLKYLAGIGFPVACILFWVKWMAPKAKDRLSNPWLLIVTFLLFEVSAAGLYFAHKHTLAIVFALVILLNIGLRFMLKSDAKELQTHDL